MANISINKTLTQWDKLVKESGFYQVIAVIQVLCV